MNTKKGIGNREQGTGMFHKGITRGLLAAALCAVGLSSFAEPSVTVGEVTAGEPWSTITVNYTLGGTDSNTNYKVAFDITAGGEIASVTNDAAKLTNGATNTVINTVTIFGKEVVDTKAKVKVSLIAVKTFVPPAGQLWKNGPIWAEYNVGGTVPGDYGNLYTFNGNKAANAAASLGNGWRLPSKDELQGLRDNCTRKWETCKDSTGADINGCRFTGQGDYKSNSIFLPAAGVGWGASRMFAGKGGNYCSSMGKDASNVWSLNFDDNSADVNGSASDDGLSVRPVRNAK